MTAQEQTNFAAFLKLLRRSVPPEASTLGCGGRLPIRRGRRVSQEEVAEAIGVSRNWYCQLECGTARASTKLLAKLASAVAFTSDQRVKLFALAIPEMGRMPISVIH